jgi:hypothetical protein
MADKELGHRIWVAMDVAEERWCLDPKQFREFLAHTSLHDMVALLEQGGLHCTPHEGP